MDAIQIEYPTDWTDYELIDSGDGAKLERFGPPAGGYTLVRPDPRALWQRTDPDKWRSVDASFVRTSATAGRWNVTKQPPNPWHVSYDGITFSLKPTEFKHVGVFPEQAVNWRWLKTQIADKPLRILNLFAYTGGATLFAAKYGAQVTHVDSVKSAISWAKENAALSSLDKAPIRWIIDDAHKFVLREIRRGAQYDGIIMDPPRFGRGTKGEVWKIEEDLPKLLIACEQLLSLTAAFVLINAYTADLSSLVLGNMLGSIQKRLEGKLVFGELGLQESASGRLLPNGIFARWCKL